jgi:organic radical activating enzyme
MKMMQRVSLPALEYHVAHGCNLSCQQCSHYSNFHLDGKLPTLADAEAEYSQWSHRLKPTRFALLGGEPLLNPAILGHIQLARQHWSDSKLMLVTNGFFLHRVPELPEVLVETECQLEVSQHGTHPDYVKRFDEVKAIVWNWRQQYPKLRINIRKSHKGWMRQYNVVDGKPMPFDSDPVVAYQVCMQRTCTQLVSGSLAKCPALAYWPKLETKARLESISEWNLFRDYEPCPPTASDNELRSFLETKSIPQCALCPSKRAAFQHPSPLEKSTLQ